MFTNINNTELKILSTFTDYRSHYIREVQKLAKVSPRTALLNLRNLEKKGVLTSQTRGKIRLYEITRSSIAQEYLILTEQYKKIEFFENNLVIKEIFEESEELMKGIVIVFGSYAKKLQKDDSDLDVFIVGKYDEKIENIAEKYGIEINIKNYPHLISDILVNEIIDNHIIVKGAERWTRWIGAENRRKV